MDYPLANTYGERTDLFLQSADDYHRHRHRISKRLNRLRRSLKITTKDTKNYSEKEKISSISAENYDMEPLFGDVLLFQIERDLLYAQETRLLLDVHSSKSKEKFLITKYKKALKTSKQLLGVIANEKNSYTVLEAYSYAGIVEGLLAISRKKYDLALYSFSVVRCCLQFLYNHQKFPDSSQYTKELYYNIIDLVVDPSLKVAGIHTRSSRISDLNQLAKEQVYQNKGLISYLDRAIDIISNENRAYITPSEESETELLKEINWGSYTAKVTSDDLALAISKVKHQVNNLIDNDTSCYDSPLILYQDAIELHSQEMERSMDDHDSEENQEQYIILTYLKYNYLLLRIRRDITILKELNNEVDSKKNSTRQKLFELWKDCLKLNDGILLSINEIKELPGIANDDDLMDSLSTLSSYFQILKQIRLADSYLISHEYVKSLALINNCEKVMKGIKFFETEFEGTLPKNEDLNSISEEINEKKSKIFVLASYFKDDNKNLSVGSKYLIDNLNKLPEFSNDFLLNNIAPLKIDFQPVNVKPVLFDIAYNYIQYQDDSADSADVQMSDDANKAPSDDSSSEKKKSGFFGLFGR